MTASGIGVLAILALVLAAVAMLPRLEVQHPAIALVRVLIPSWRFFDDISESPLLLARVANPDAPFGPWLPVLHPPRRALRDVLWNPGGNLALACNALVEHLVADLADFDESGADFDESVADFDESGAIRAEELVSYQLVLNLVRSTLAARSQPATGIRLQFKLAERASTTTSTPGDVMISLEHAL